MHLPQHGSALLHAVVFVCTYGAWSSSCTHLSVPDGLLSLTCWRMRLCTTECLRHLLALSPAKYLARETAATQGRKRPLGITGTKIAFFNK